MLREPVLFANTRFLVDRLHYPNHKACSHAFNMEEYRTLKGINTQVCEQGHRRFNKMRASLAYMSQTHYMEFVRYFLYVDNGTFRECGRSQNPV